MTRLPGDRAAPAPGTAAPAHDGVLGIVARVPSQLGRRFDAVAVQRGPVTILVEAVENVRANWHAVAFPNGGIGGRAPVGRGRRGIRTIPGARWLEGVKGGSVGKVHLRGSGPRGGRPR
jgi:hypothetical protein